MKIIITIMASMTLLSATYLFSANAAEKTQLDSRTPPSSIIANVSSSLASLSLRSNQVVDWVLIDANQQTLIIKQKSELSRKLPAGDYTVRAILRNIPVQKLIKLKSGDKVEREMNIPVGRVKLIATQEDQPLFRPVSWKVYRLNKQERQQVGKYRLHSQLISIPPGHYEAVAEYNGKLRKRRFWIRPNTMNNVVLAMD